MPKRNNHVRRQNQKFAHGELNRLGRDFKRKRLAAALTHAEIQARTGISVSTVHHLEHGRGVNMETYVILLRCVGYRLE